jgi:hypothetical protein
VPTFPPPTPVSIVVDGRPLAAYVRAYAFEGRVYAPVSPLLTRLADRVWSQGDELVIQRGNVRIRVALAHSLAGQLNGDFVAVGPVLRALGASVRYEPSGRRLIVRVPPRAVVESPTPFDPNAPSVRPSAVFTAPVSPSPRPAWTGSPLPRRTPLPAPPPVRRRAFGH